MALPGFPLPPAWSFPFMSPAVSPGAPARLGQAVCSVLGRPPWCQVEETSGNHGASLTQHSGQHPPTDFITLDGPRQGFRGPAASPGSHFIPALLTGKSLSNSMSVAQRGRSYTRLLPAHGALMDRHLPGYGAHLGRHPTAHGAHVVRSLPGYGPHLGRHPGRAWCTETLT